MESFFSRYKNALVLMIFVLAQVVLLAMQVRRPAPDMPDGHNVRLWRYLVSSVVTPPGRLAHNVGRSVRGVWSNYIYLRNLRQQNQNLQAENDRLRLEQASLAQDAREAQQLRDLLDFRGRYIDKTLPAQVIGTSGTDQARAVYIDKGFKDGLQAQMPVITPDGVVGKVKNVFPHTAQVLLISDQTSGAGVILQSTRTRGVMKGNASGEPQMINISPDERIKAGEEVVTSGGDQVYPAGLPVGVVARVTADPDSAYVNVIVKPNANLSELEQVLVITQISDKMPFAQVNDVAQSEAAAQAQKQRAADVLSDRLPSLRDVKTAETAQASGDDSDAPTDGGDPARPMRPPQALHPDRYTPGAAAPAASLTPGAAPPVTHREPTAEAAAAKTPKPSTANAGTASIEMGRSVVPMNRFPAKPTPTAVPAAPISTPGVAAGTMGTTTERPPPSATGTLPKTASASATGATAARNLPITAGTPAKTAPAGAPSTTPAKTAVLSPGTPPKTASTGAGTALLAGSPPTTSSAANPASGLKPIAKSSGTGSLANAPTAGAPAAPRVPQASQTGQPAAAPVRRVTIPSNSVGGILTPAGIGPIGGAARPKTAPAGTNATGSPATKPQTPGSTTPSRPPAPKPAAPPGGA